MNDERLLDIVKKENDRDALGMILSNCIDMGSSEGGLISVKNFDKVIDLILEWEKSRGKNDFK